MLLCCNLVFLQEEGTNLLWRLFTKCGDRGKTGTF